MEKKLLKTIKYFTFFSYAPSFEQIHTFLPVKITKIQLKKRLDQMVREGQLIKKTVNKNNLAKISNFSFLSSNFSLLTLELYTLPPHRILFKKRIDRAILSKNKVNKVSHYLKILSSFPQINLVGLSGAVAVEGASKTDDVDLFIIAGQGRLWTARFLAVFLAELFGLRRRRKAKKVKDKVCLNLFFEESNLSVLKSKRNVYVGHEILQMKPLVNKDRVYERFLAANSWAYGIFPNVRPIGRGEIGMRRSLTSPFSLLTSPFTALVEGLLKTLQLYIIEKHKTTEIITDTQLWFHPADFEKTLKEEKII